MLCPSGMATASSLLDFSGRFRRHFECFPLTRGSRTLPSLHISAVADHPAARATGEDLIGARFLLLQDSALLPAMAILASESILPLQGKSYGVYRPSTVPG